MSADMRNEVGQREREGVDEAQGEDRNAGWTTSTHKTSGSERAPVVRTSPMAGSIPRSAGRRSDLLGEQGVRDDVRTDPPLPPVDEGVAGLVGGEAVAHASSLGEIDPDDDGC